MQHRLSTDIYYALREKREKQDLAVQIPAGMYAELIRDRKLIDTKHSYCSRLKHRPAVRHHTQ